MAPFSEAEPMQSDLGRNAAYNMTAHLEQAVACRDNAGSADNSASPNDPDAVMRLAINRARQ
jgi:hypothetical protein